MAESPRTLPPRPNLDHLRGQARRLQRAFGLGDPQARARVAANLPRHAAAARLLLADAQCVVAREYGFTSWPRLKLHVDAASDPHKAALAAARLGEPERLRALLRGDPTLVARLDGDGLSLLHHACGHVSRQNPRRLEVLRVILEHGADPNVALDDGQRPLHFAAQNGLAAACEFLLDHGADPALADRDGGTPLHHALYSGSAAAAELLARRGPVDDNLRTAAGLGRLDLLEGHLGSDGALAPSAGRQRGWFNPHWHPPRDRSDRPEVLLAEALGYAVANDRLEAARRLVLAGARFDAPAIKAVATSGRDDLVELLLSTGPELTLPGEWGWTAWQWANFAGHEALGRRLKELAAPGHLPTAAELGRLDLVEALLARGADPSQTNHEGTTALGLALGARSLMAPRDREGSPEVAARLDAAGAQLNLAAAAKLGRLDHLERHLRAGADPAAALAAAVEARQLAVIERLERAGAVIDLHDAARLGWTDQVLARLPEAFDWHSLKDGDTLLDRAIESGSAPLVAALLERGAPLCAPGYGELFGKAAVHVAAWSGAAAEIWDLLLEHGADINHASDPGTPFDCARMAHRPETMAVIRERGGLASRELEGR